MKKNHLRWTGWVLMAVVSLFLQILHWTVYEITAFSIWFAAVTPLVLCLVYHLFQSDCEETFHISRKQVFLGAVLIPIIAACLASVMVFLNNPDLGLYASHGQLTGSFMEKIGLYSGRCIISGIYLLVFSVIDIPLLRIQDERRYIKKSAELTEEDLVEKQVYMENPEHAQEESE